MPVESKLLQRIETRLNNERKVNMAQKENFRTSIHGRLKLPEKSKIQVNSETTPSYKLSKAKSLDHAKLGSSRNQSLTIYPNQNGNEEFCELRYGIDDDKEFDKGKKIGEQDRNTDMEKGWLIRNNQVSNEPLFEETL